MRSGLRPSGRHCKRWQASSLGGLAEESESVMPRAFPLLEEVPGLNPGTPSGQSREVPAGGKASGRKVNTLTRRGDSSPVGPPHEHVLDCVAVAGHEVAGIGVEGHVAAVGGDRGVEAVAVSLDPGRIDAHQVGPVQLAVAHEDVDVAVACRRPPGCWQPSRRPRSGRRRRSRGRSCRCFPGPRPSRRSPGRSCAACGRARRRRRSRWCRRPPGCWQPESKAT